MMQPLSFTAAPIFPQGEVRSLRQLLQRAVDRSQYRERPVLATYSLPFDSFRDLSQVALPADDSFFLWQRAEQDVTFAALGQTVRFTASGENRFAELQGQLASLIADAVVEQPETSMGLAPLCLAGFAFDPQQQAEQIWSDFPEGLAMIPRLLFARRGPEAFLTINLLVDRTSNVEAMVADVEEQVGAALNPGTQAGPSTQVQLPAAALDLTDEAGWCAAVAALKQRIARGEAQKVVLARSAHLRAGADFSVAEVIARLSERYRNCTVFAVANGSSCFLGATPEMLVSLQHGVVKLDSLAGSAARGKDQIEDEVIGQALLRDEKELWEHSLVTRGLLQSLEGICSDVESPEKPGLRKMANVQHLHTPIEAVTEPGRHILELVERLHPTPATAGLPMQDSMCLIRQFEDFDRGWYAGPVGWMDAAGNGEFAVALRSALVREGDAWLFAGCGIVSASDPERELRESSMKLEAMLWALSPDI